MRALLSLQRQYRIAGFLFLLTLPLFSSAQTLDTVTIVSKARKFKPGDHILLMFEILDTVDASGKKSTMSRAYYFDEKNRMVSSVREYYNPNKPEKGTQVIYSFGVNKLASVTVTPSKSICRNCTTRYYYFNDSLLSRQGKDYANANPSNFIRQAHYFQSKLPKDLPWGYFNNEVLVNGKLKKIKKAY